MVALTMALAVMAMAMVTLMAMMRVWIAQLMRS